MAALRDRIGSAAWGPDGLAEPRRRTRPHRRGGGYAVTFGGIGYDAAERMAQPSSPRGSPTPRPN
jgi:hypothetical protein